MKRKVAYWKSSLLPYSETFVRTQAESLRRYEPHYLGLTHSRELDLELPPQRTWILEDHVRTRVPVVACKVLGSSRPLRTELRERNVELLHAHFGTEGWRALRVARPLGLPVVVTFHGADATMSDRAMRASSHSGRQLVTHRRALLSGAAKVIAVSDYIGQRLTDAGCPPDRLVVHHIGVDTSWFAPGPPLPRREPWVLFVGRLVEKKGLAHLMEAMAMLRNSSTMSPVRLIVAGDGPDRERLVALASRLRLEMDFLGRRSHSEVRSLMQSAMTVVVPSQDAVSGESEGLPTVIREAQACGTPVLASDTAGASEAVADGRTGLLVTPRDPQALCRALERLLSQPGLWERLSTAGTEAARLVDVKGQVTKLEALYDEVLASAGT